MILKEHPFAIAITIAIENRSGKISNRFSFHNRIAIFPVNSILYFHLKNGSRLKTGFYRRKILNRDKESHKFQLSCLVRDHQKNGEIFYLSRF